jgi:hypothetical protein
LNIKKSSKVTKKRTRIHRSGYKHLKRILFLTAICSKKKYGKKKLTNKIKKILIIKRGGFSSVNLKYKKINALIIEIKQLNKAFLIIKLFIH